MAVTGVNNYTNYTNYYTDTKNVSEGTQKADDKQKTDKTYSSSREYKNYLTEKYDCLTNKDYPITINSSLLQKAVSDEKTAQWLEYNLSIMPQAIAKEKALIEASGAKIISYNCTINGYDSMTTQVCTTTDPDGKIAKENAEKRAEEKKKEEEKLKEKRAEKNEKEEKAAEKAAEEERLYKLRIDGKNVMDVTEKIGNAVSSIHTETSIGKNHIRFDMMA